MNLDKGVSVGGGEGLQIDEMYKQSYRRLKAETPTAEVRDEIKYDHNPRKWRTQRRPAQM